MRRYFWLMAGAALALASVAGLTGCEQGHSVTFENRTSVAVAIFEGRSEATKLEPMESETFDFFEYQGSRRFEARDESGRVLLREELTWEDLKDRGWRIVITEPAPDSSPSE